MLAGNTWLHHRTDAARDEAIAQKRTQWIETLALTREPFPWTPSRHEALERALGARITLLPAAAPPRTAPEAAPDGRWSFLAPLPAVVSADGLAAQVSFPAPPAARLMRTYQFVAAALLALAFCFLIVLASAAVWIARRDRARDDVRGPARRADVSSLAQLARTSVRQGELLETERTERLRLEEDLNVHHLLLNRALEHKVRLGQDLHDGIIQSLYAHGLTLEAAKNALTHEPDRARALLDQSRIALNTTIREVRAFIHGLSSEQVTGRPLSEAVRSLVASLGAHAAAEYQLDIDDATASTLTEAEQADLLQIIREAVSNSVRHGAARRLTIELREHHDGPTLNISDDGRGFDPRHTASRGHGLANIEARSRRLRATCAIDSAPRRGTALRVTLPRRQPAPVPA